MKGGSLMKFGDNLRNLRKSKKMSQEKLAELADLNRNFVGMIERGETNLTIKKLECIANAFNMDIKDLFSFVI